MTKNTTTWLGKRVRISVSIFQNLEEEPFFICNSDPYQRVASFTGAPEKLVFSTLRKKKNLSPDIETTIKIKLFGILEKLTQGHIRRQQVTGESD